MTTVIRRALIALTLLASALSAGPVAAADDTPTSPNIIDRNICVTIFEDSLGNKDHWTVCSTDAVQYPRNANLTGDTTGITNGCDSQYWPFTGSDWNDCVDYIKYTGLPTNYRVVFYWNANYATRLACYDTAGSYQHRILPGDEMTSWRVEGSNC